MNKTKTYRLVLAGVLVALGVLLPYLTGHMFGLPGTVFLPMHIPVLLIGLLCGPTFGAIGGVLIPALSSALTGMPPVFPMLPIMIGELVVYGAVSGLLYRRAKMPLLPSMLIAMVGGRIMYGLVFAGLLLANNGALKALSVTVAFVTGIPGIIAQLILVPLIVVAVNRTTKQGNAIKDLTFEKARKMIKAGQASCIVIKDGQIARAESGPGVKPLIRIVDSELSLLKDAFVVDKVIGKAAALLIVLGGATRAHGEIMSQAACDYLSSRGVAYSFGQRIDVISNRAGDGMCPLENAVLDIDDPAEGLQRLRETIKLLMSAG